MGARIRFSLAAFRKFGKLKAAGAIFRRAICAPISAGKTARAETVEVKWPSGLQQTFRNVEADKFYLIEEGTDRLNIQRFARPARAIPLSFQPLPSSDDRISTGPPKGNIDSSLNKVRPKTDGPDAFSRAPHPKTEGGGWVRNNPTQAKRRLEWAATLLPWAFPGRSQTAFPPSRLPQLPDSFLKGRLRKKDFNKNLACNWIESGHIVR